MGWTVLVLGTTQAWIILQQLHGQRHYRNSYVWTSVWINHNFALGTSWGNNNWYDVGTPTTAMVTSGTVAGATGTQYVFCWLEWCGFRNWFNFKPNNNEWSWNATATWTTQYYLNTTTLMAPLLAQAGTMLAQLQLLHLIQQLHQEPQESNTPSPTGQPMHLACINIKSHNHGWSKTASTVWQTHTTWLLHQSA